MKNTGDLHKQAAELRQQAEEIALKKQAPSFEKLETMSLEEIWGIIRDLQGHQIELEMQNKELLRAQTELDTQKERYFDLYDLAPVGYCTISEQGIILEANFTASTLLGAVRGALASQPISCFILREDQNIFYLRQKQLFQTGRPQEYHLRMVRKDGTIFWAHLEAIIKLDERGTPVCRFVLNDISEHKIQEDIVDLATRLIAKINSPDDLRQCLSNLTDSLQKWSGCEAVGIRLKDGDDFPYFETRGFPTAFVQLESNLCVHRPNGEILRDNTGNPVLECMCGNILRGRFDPAKPFFTANGSFWSNNTTTLLASTTEADRQARTRNRCNGEGYESVALIPLRIDHQTLGLLQFNDHRPDRFSPALIAHFEKIAGIVTIALWRRQTEERLHESEKLYRSLFENMMNGFAYCRMLFENREPRDFIYLAVNKAFEQQTGLKEVVGRKVTEILPGVRDSDPELFEIYGRVAMTGEPESFEIYVEALHMWFSISVYSPAHEHFVAVFDVITERKRAEEELRTSESHLRTLIQSIPDLVWLKDKDGIYMSCNSQFERLYGARESDIIGKSDYNFVDKDLAEFFRENDRKTVAAGKPTSNEEWVTFADDGHRALLEVIKNPMYDDKEELIGVLGIGRDITERMRAEEERANLQNQLIQAQKMESVGRLAGGVAHDYNNMLSVIMGYSELALEKVDATNEPLHDYLREIYAAAVRSTDITRQLLAFARKQTIAPVVIDLNQAVENMLKMLRRLIGEDIDLAWLPKTDLWPVKFDPSQLDQILANMCVNARDAIDGVGRITIETGTVTFDEDYCASHRGFIPGEYVLLAVSDDGCGMEHEIVDKIFEPFFTTKAVGQGTGLGLSMVYGIVKQNQGFINVYSEPGKGTTLKIYLARHTSLAVEILSQHSEDISVGYGEVILVVEDEVSILNFTKRLLEDLEYTVLTANSPSQALDLVKEHQYRIDLLITDVIMPEMNGRELSTQLHNVYPGLKTLFMSGYTANAIAHHGVLDVGINFIQKPFSKKVLAIKIREALKS